MDCGGGANAAAAREANSRRVRVVAQPLRLPARHSCRALGSGVPRARDAPGKVPAPRSRSLADVIKHRLSVLDDGVIELYFGFRKTFLPFFGDGSQIGLLALPLCVDELRNRPAMIPAAIVVTDQNQAGR